MSGLVLSLFPGIGLLDMAFEEEGFCVVRGPDLLWGGDVRRFHPPAGRFDGIIGGPPCQIFSRLRFVNPKAGQKHGNMIPEFERCVVGAQPEWFVMENVEGAPEPQVAGYEVRSTMIRDYWVGGVTDRKRRFSFGTLDGRRLRPEVVALHAEPEHSALAGGGGRPSACRPDAGRTPEADGTEELGLQVLRCGGRARPQAGLACRLPFRCTVYRAGQAQGNRQRRPAPDGPRHRPSCESRPRRPDGGRMKTRESCNPGCNP